MKNPLIYGCAVLATALLAGCGSSKSSSTESATTAANTAAAKTPSRYGAGGASTTSSPASTTTAVAVTTKQNKLGTILAAGPKHATVYMFEADQGGKSACAGVCAQNWPPVTSSAQAMAGGAVSASKLGMTTRSDGTKQITYNGHPLYFFVKDGDAEDAYGQGVKAFGADWYVLAPSGNKIDKDEGKSKSGNAS